MIFKDRLSALIRVVSARKGTARSDAAAYSRERLAQFAKIQELMDYEFRDLSLLALSLVHRSHVHLAGATRLDSNERLEYLGDAVLGLVANEYLYLEFPDSQEGDLTKMKSKLVCGDSLARTADKLDLGQFIQMSKGEASSGGRHRASILADVVEAIFGAVYLDGGFGAARRVVYDWIIQDADELLALEALGNYKSRLQEVVQARYKFPPRYQVVSQHGPDHDKIFLVRVRVADRIMGEGRGPSKKMAEQQAAKMALEGLGDDAPDVS